jgi:hypothetical protein
MTYRIGTTLENMTDLETLFGRNIEPTSSYMEGERRIELGNRQKKWVGLPWAIWEFALLEVEMRAALRAYCDPDGSADVYIETRMPDDSFEIFAVTMWWPDEDQRDLTDTPANLRIEFHNLVVVEGSGS